VEKSTRKQIRSDMCDKYKETREKRKGDDSDEITMK
jgi:hypothetical protein